MSDRLEDLLREVAPQVLTAVLRRGIDLGTAEDAVQEALLAAASQWPVEGFPADPRAWTIRVAWRRTVDVVRAESARRRREDLFSLEEPEPAPTDADSDVDDSLDLFFLCAHPALTAPAAVALTLRAVGGLSTAEIAAGLLVPEATVAQRISRAKKTIQAAGGRFGAPTPAEFRGRVDHVLQVLYLVFTEGHTTSAGEDLLRHDLAAEAIRLLRLLRTRVPDDPEVTGLLALVLLTDARRAARTGPAGELVPLDEQDRDRWDRPRLEEGSALVEQALRRGSVGSFGVGPFTIQAAIAAVHAQAPSTAQTDWPQVLALYSLLARATGQNPVVLLNRAVAVAMVSGPRAGLAEVERIADDPRLARGHRVAAVRGHLLERTGDLGGAAEQYRLAAGRTTNLPERRYLLLRASRVARAE